MFEVINLSSVLPDGRLSHFSMSTMAVKPEIRGLLCPNTSWIDELSDIFSEKMPIGQGEILLDGESVVTANGLSNLNLVSRSTYLYEDCSILENLYMAEKKGVFYNKSKCAAKYNKLFDKMDIQIELTRKVRQLSRKDRKIVELLRCFIMDTKVLVLYDVASYFPYGAHSELTRILNQFKREGTEILYLTDKWEEALKLCDSITVVSNGKNINTFTKDQMRNNPRDLYYSMLGQDGQIERTLNKDEQEQIAFFEILQESKDIINEGHDRNVYLVEYLKKVMNYIHADSSIIYLVDATSDGSYRIVASDRAKEEPYILTLDTIRNFIQEDFFYINHNDHLFSSYFINGENDLKTVMGCSIQLYNKIKILIQVSYTKYYVYTAKDKYYLSTACREVGVLIENSRLAGESILLQESHHRIKNNLQLVISLLEMEKCTISDRVENHHSEDALKDIIDETIYRIKSIASIHNILAHNSSINSMISITSVMKQLSELYQERAVISMQADEFEISNKRATSLILVLNELISNGVKHGGSRNSLVNIKLSILADGEQIKVTYQDDGKGFSKDFDLDKDGNIGTLILTSIINNEFKGTIEHGNKNGAYITIQFPEKSLNDMSIGGLRY